MERAGLFVWLFVDNNILPILLFRLRSIYRTYISAGSALYAFFRIDNILGITSRNTANGTFSFAGSAAYALIMNIICHNSTPPKL
jgi:hypothetical protein